jgi:NADPH-dependent F420 reductase
MIGFLGGTGPEGRGLAIRLGLAGNPVMIGSRDLSKSKDIANALREGYGLNEVYGASNEDVAAESDVLFITVPYTAQGTLLRPLRDTLEGKIVVNTLVPLGFKDGLPYILDINEGSASLESQSILPQSKVVSAFQTVSARELLNVRVKIEGDVVVCSDHVDAKTKIMSIVESIPDLRAIDGGSLLISSYVESVTALLLNLNFKNNARTGIKITGI